MLSFGRNSEGRGSLGVVGVDPAPEVPECKLRVLVQGLIALVVSHSAYWKPVKSLERVRAKVATKNTI